MQAKEGMEGALTLRRWRRGAKLTRPAAAKELGISERMLARHEPGTHRAPRTVLLAVQGLSGERGDRPAMTRDRWVALAGRLLDYDRGAPVAGRMLRGRDREGLRDFLDFVRSGPDADLALTDPALFRTLRSAATRAQLSGLARYRVAEAA